MLVDVPIAIQSDQAEPQSDIIVVGTRSEQGLKIDRRTYRVRRNANTAQKNAVQLLRGVPAVTVSPNDEILLLGRPSVRIFVDGRPYPGNISRYLRTLRGSEIERIEVITNPSAQYSAEGTGGIINLVLRNRPGAGLSGSVASEVSSIGRSVSDGSVKYKRGRWTYEFEAHAAFGTSARRTLQRQRVVQAGAERIGTGFTESGNSRSKIEAPSASAKATLEIDERTKVAARVAAADERFVRTAGSTFVGLDGTPLFDQRQRVTDAVPFLNGELTFDRRGSSEGETLSASLSVFDNPNSRTRTVAAFSDGSGFLVDQKVRQTVTRGQVDWQHPMADNQILTIGSSANLVSTSQRYTFTDTRPDVALGPDALDQYQVRNHTFAGYATYQRPVGKWTVMPGLRLEWNRRQISSPGSASVAISRTNAFPTLHIARSLGRNLELTASYSKRIDRASAENLRPYPVVRDVFNIVQGNPDLADQSVDAYELNLQYNRRATAAGLTVYYRRTDDLWSTSYTVTPTGVSVSTLVNAGYSLDSGLELNLTTPITKRMKTTTSINLFYYRGPVSAFGERVYKSNFRYLTNTTLEWTGPARDKVPGDTLQLQWVHTSSNREFQLRTDAFDWLSLSYTHNLDRKFSVTGTVSYQSPTGSRLFAPLIQENSRERQPVEFRVKLLKIFGND